MQPRVTVWEVGSSTVTGHVAYILITKATSVHAVGTSYGQLILGTRLSRRCPVSSSIHQDCIVWKLHAKPLILFTSYHISLKDPLLPDPFDIPDGLDLDRVYEDENDEEDDIE